MVFERPSLMRAKSRLSRRRSGRIIEFGPLQGLAPRPDMVLTDKQRAELVTCTWSMQFRIAQLTGRLLPPARLDGGLSRAGRSHQCRGCAQKRGQGGGRGRLQSQGRERKQNKPLPSDPPPPLTVAAVQGLLEKKWSSVLRLQKKLMALEEENKQLRERSAAAGPGPRRAGAALLPVAPALFECKGHRGGLACVQCHPVYPLLATASEDATVKVWDTESGQLERSLKGHTNAVNWVAFSHAGGVLASASSDLSLKLWDTETWDCVRTMQGHDHSVSCVAFSPDDAQLVSCSRDQTIRLWDAQTAEENHALSFLPCLQSLSSLTQIIHQVIAQRPCGVTRNGYAPWP